LFYLPIGYQKKITFHSDITKIIFISFKDFNNLIINYNLSETDLKYETFLSLLSSFTRYVIK